MSNEQWSASIPWPGPDGPNDKEMMVVVEFKDGVFSDEQKAKNFIWTHRGDIDDIIAYRYKLDDKSIPVTPEEDEAFETIDNLSQKEVVNAVIDGRITAADILSAGFGHMKDRAKTYDKDGVGGERSIKAAVDAFNAITGEGLMNSAERGWLFMIVLKAVRSQQGEFKLDNYEDLAAYAGLAGEAAASERG